MPEPSLELLQTLVERMLAKQDRFNDDMAVLTAIVLRLDHSQAAMLTEIRAMHAQYFQMDRRVRALEEAGPPA